MPRLATLIGSLLVLLGLGTYLFSESRSFTALIPSILGLLFVACGLLASREALLRHAMHGAAVVSLLGVLGSMRALPQLGALLTGGDVARPLAVFAQGATLVLCLVFLVAAVRWFVRARVSRRRGAA